MRHHAAAYRSGFTVGTPLDVQKALRVVLFDVRMMAMHSSLRREIVT